MASKVKYVAAGFLEDAGRLLNEFIECENPFEFSTFAPIWRKHQFSLIFMGRPDDTELTEFTNEVFRIVSQFLSTSSFIYKVGAIFLLYALYRNQISEPMIKIRLELSQWLTIKAVRQEAIEKGYISLHYVIDYLNCNAFIFVKNQTLRGPVITNIQKTTKNSEKISNFYANYKIELTDYSSSNKLVELQKCQRLYADIKKGLNCDVKLNKSATPDVYEKLLGDLDSILSSPRKGKKLRTEDIGNRRAELKSASFSRKTSKFRDKSDDFLTNLDDVNDRNYEPVKRRWPCRKGRRVPAHERRVGRPSKKTKVKKEEVSEEDTVESINLDNLFQQQQDFFLPPDIAEKRQRAVRAPYYKLSPKRDDDDSS